MRVFGAGESNEMWRTVVAQLQRGRIGIVPTDTIYGLSGDATSPDVVDRIAHIKQRARPSSIIPPHHDWVIAHIAARARPWFRRALNRRNAELRRGCAEPETWLLPIGRAGRANLPKPLWESGYLGVRMCAHFAAVLAFAADVPLISTSVNRTSASPMTDLHDLDPALAEQVDFIVYEGERRGAASTLLLFDRVVPTTLSR